MGNEFVGAHLYGGPTRAATIEVRSQPLISSKYVVKGKEAVPELSSLFQAPYTT